jgi:hypothetical protein
MLELVLIATERGVDLRTRSASLDQHGGQVLAESLPWHEAPSEIVGRLGKGRWKEPLEYLSSVVDVAKGT